MRIMIIRHAEPDYENNTITKNGWIEAEALKERLLKEQIDHIYISPLGRALDTAKPFLNASKKSFEICQWLEEFSYPTTKLDGKPHLAWDMPVPYMNEHTKLYNIDEWMNDAYLKNSNFSQCYEQVCQKLDETLQRHGYQRKNRYYEVISGNKDTIVFFCHLGTECVLLSHLLSIPSIVLAQHFAPVPSSVSILYTEERREGIAQFRAQCLGDISHLYVKNITPSMMGRFQENYFDNGRKD